VTESTAELNLDERQPQVSGGGLHRRGHLLLPSAVGERNVESVDVDQRVETVAMSKCAVEAVDPAAKEACDAPAGRRGWRLARRQQLDRPELWVPGVEDSLSVGTPRNSRGEIGVGTLSGVPARIAIGVMATTNGS